MSDPIWVRELSTDELPRAQEAKTGDILPDGSVLLWREDMNRMGLQGLRRWILEKVVDHQTTIAVVSEPAEKPRIRDEMI